MLSLCAIFGINVPINKLLDICDHPSDEHIYPEDIQRHGENPLV